MSTFTPNLKLEKPDGTDFVNIGLLNGNFDILDDLVPPNMVDYPIEIGTEGFWHWEKWKSGKAVCYTTRMLKTQILKAWGNVFESNTRIDPFPLPTNFFIDVPNMTITGQPYNTGVILSLEISENISENQTPRVYVTRADPNSELKNYQISYVAIGRWK